jgi:DNA-binding response OmpR family regulator
MLPTGLSVKEEREAARALRGKILRQEIYAEERAILFVGNGFSEASPAAQALSQDHFRVFFAASMTEALVVCREHLLGSVVAELPALGNEPAEAIQRLLREAHGATFILLDAPNDLNAQRLLREAGADEVFSAPPSDSKLCEEVRKAGHPYTVSERNYELKLLKQADRDGHAVFFAHPRETINLHYERNPRDPRMQHEVVLAVDDFGNVTRTASLAYPRRAQQRQRDEAARTYNLSEQDRLWALVSDASFINRGEQVDDYLVTSPMAAAGHPVPLGNEPWYRVGLPVETTTWELTGLEAPERPGDNTDVRLERWRALTIEHIRAAIASASGLSLTFDALFWPQR